jgi:8-oxo-dGTP diphosphatase
MTIDTKHVVVCLLKNKHGEYLMTRPSDEKKFGKYQDAWAFPGGHVHENESTREAIVREIKEELNIDVIPIKLIAEQVFDIPGETAFWWECNMKNVNQFISISSEISEYKWVDSENIKTLKIWPAMEKFLKQYIWK